MPENKHAEIRYRVLDQCFSRKTYKYDFDKLREKCQQAIAEVTGEAEDECEVSVRTLRNDINFMKQHWKAPIKCFHDTNPPHYAYTDSGFSIYKKSFLTPAESQLLLDTIQMLSRFKGFPQFDELSDVVKKLKKEFKLGESGSKVVSFEQNEFVHGLEFFTPLLHAILNKQTVVLNYESYLYPKAQYHFSPYYLKQYAQRWYVFGRAEECPYMMNLALDRIKKLRNCKRNFIENLDVDFEEYFEDIIGVTHYENSKVETVKLKVDPDFAGYFLSKPLHWTQRGKLTKDGVCTLKVRINRELENKLLTMSPQVEVLEPLVLRNTIRERLKQALAKLS